MLKSKIIIDLLAGREACRQPFEWRILALFWKSYPQAAKKNSLDKSTEKSEELIVTL